MRCKVAKTFAPPGTIYGKVFLVRHLFVYLFLIALLGCHNAEYQEIDLSDRVLAEPADGVGHYVYAMSLPRQVVPGERFEAQMEWRTVGSVDPNARYLMDVVLRGESAEKIYDVPASANTVGELHISNWLSYRFDVPADFPPGPYAFGIRLRDAVNETVGEQLFVPLGYRPEFDMADGFSRLATLEVVPEGTAE